MKQKIKIFLVGLWKSKLFKFFFFTFLVYKLIFNVFTAQFALNKIFPSLSTGTLQSNVKRFSLFYGIIIEDIDLRSGEDFENKSLLTTKRLALTYNLPLLFLGRLKISEVSLIDPDIRLWQKNGKWNYETIMKPSEPTPEEPKEESPPSDELNVYVPVSAYANIKIENLKLEMLAEKGKNFFHAKLEDFTFRLLLDTKRFRKIPYNLKALEIIDILQIGLNPEKPIQVLAKDNSSEIQTPLNLLLLLNRDSSYNPEKFSLSMNIGNKNIPILLDKNRVNFGLELLGDMSFIPEEDKLDLKNLSFQFSETKWLEIKGKVMGISTPKPNVDIQFSETNINLEPVSRILNSLPFSPGIQLAGNISLQKLFAKGNLDQIGMGGRILANAIAVSGKVGKHSIPFFDFQFDGMLNLSDSSPSTEENILPILERFTIHCKTEYNGIEAELNGEVRPKSLVDLLLKVKNVNLNQFTSSVYGDASLELKLTGEKLSYLNADLHALLRQIQYKMGRGISGRQDLDLKVKTVVDLKSGFALEDLQIEKLILLLKNSLGEVAVSLQSDLNLDLKKGLLVEINRISLSSNMTNLIPTLPTALKTTIAGIRSGLGNKLDLNGSVVYSKIGSGEHIGLKLGGSFPAIELKDLNILVDMNLLADKASTIQLNKIHLDAFEKKLKADYSGKFYKAFTPNPPYGDLTGELKGNFTLESNTPRYVLKGITFSGDIDLDLVLKGPIIKGKLHSTKSYLKYQDACPGEKCLFYELFGIQLNIPFEHNVQDTTTDVLTSGNADNLVQNYGGISAPNLNIDTIKGSHPYLPNSELVYVSPKDGYPGLSGYVDYHDNVLRVDNLRIFILNGLVFARDILFNVGSGDSKQMEYSAVLQIRDIDFKQLLREDLQDKIDDGKIKADLNVKGRDLTDPVGNMDLFFTIFQIGKDFGKSAINIVSPTNFITDRIINNYTVNRVEVELSKGLVYAKVQFDESLLNRVLFRIEDNRIKQERIPIASFLARTKDELSGYQ